MADTASPSSSAIMGIVEGMIEWALFVGGFAFAGMSILSVIPSQNLEGAAARACNPGSFESRMTLVFAVISFGLIVACLAMMTWVKMELQSRFREDVDGSMRKHGAATASLRLVIFLGQVVLYCGFITALVTVCFMSQVKSEKFSCMSAGIRVLVIVFIGAVPSIFMLVVYRTTVSNFGERTRAVGMA